MAEIPAFVRIPKIGFGRVVIGVNTYDPASMTNEERSDSLIKVFTAGANGSLIYNLQIQSLGTNVANVVRFFIKDIIENKYYLIYEEANAATTVSQTAKLAAKTVQMNLKLQANFEIYALCSTTLATGYDVTVTGGDF